ncbi:hypothetical protein ACHQM5_018299 [Ranunculus cassubicifolius]
MARLCLTFITLCLLLTLSSLPSSDARKLLNMEKLKHQQFTVSSSPSPSSPSANDALFTASLAKGKVPPSAPSKRGNSMIVNERLFTVHLATLDRILRSVPSPGVGH